MDNLKFINWEKTKNPKILPTSKNSIKWWVMEEWDKWDKWDTWGTWGKWEVKAAMNQ